MAQLTATQVNYIKLFFAQQAESLQERIDLEEYDDADELEMLAADIAGILAVEITQDPKSVYSALGVCDNRDSMVAVLEQEQLGAEIVELVYNAVLFSN
jgi:hypothetical protein